MGRKKERKSVWDIENLDELLTSDFGFDAIYRQIYEIYDLEYDIRTINNERYICPKEITSFRKPPGIEIQNRIEREAYLGKYLNDKKRLMIDTHLCYAMQLFLNIGESVSRKDSEDVLMFGNLDIWTSEEVVELEEAVKDFANFFGPLGIINSVFYPWIIIMICLLIL